MRQAQLKGVCASADSLGFISHWVRKRVGLGTNLRLCASVSQRRDSAQLKEDTHHNLQCMWGGTDRCSTYV